MTARKRLTPKGFLWYDTCTMKAPYPIRPPYPPDWFDIAEAARVRAGHKCVECGMQGLTPAEYPTWDSPEHRPLMLEVHHADGNPANCADDNLQPLCHTCHLEKHRLMRAQRKRAAEEAAGQTAII